MNVGNMVAVKKKDQSNNIAKDVLVIVCVTLFVIWIAVQKLGGYSHFWPGGSGKDAVSFARNPSLKGAQNPEGDIDDDGELKTESEGGQLVKNSAKDLLSSTKPYLIYGTAWKKDKTSHFVSDAISTGFRFVDTANQPKHYNEAQVGYGWKSAAEKLGITREDLFLQTKFTSLKGHDQNVPYDSHASLEDQVKESVQGSLRNLQSEYIDSLVLHSLMRTMDETMEVWRAFESFVQSGKVRQLGLSNCYDIQKFKHVYEKASIKPKVLQNRFYSDSNFDIELRELCKELGVTYQSFWTLTGNRKALALAEWKEIAIKKELTAQTLMYVFMMALGHTPLDGSTNAKHMEEDIEAMQRFHRGDILLSEIEMSKLSSLLGMPE